LTREGGKADKRRNLLAAAGPKLRQLGNERARDYRPDARHREEQVLFLAPDWRTTHAIVNVAVELGSSRSSAFTSLPMLFLMRELARFSRCPSAPIMSTI